MFKIEKSKAGLSLWHLYFNGVQLQTFDRRWQAVEAMRSLARTYTLADKYA